MEQKTGLSEFEKNSAKEVVADKPNILPLAPIRRILKEVGINMISKDALLEIRDMLQDILREQGRNIVVAQNHRKKNIATKEDVLLALRLS